MSKGNTSVNKTISKIEVIKKIADDQTGLVDAVFDKFGKNVSNDISQKVTSTISDIKSNISSIQPPKTDMFKEMLDIANSFIDDPNVSLDGKEKKLIRYTKESARKSIQSSKEIIKEEVGKLLTGSISENCAGNATISSGTTYNVSPKEFDFLNVLKINPSSLTGKIMYENTTTNTGKIQFNQELYGLFNSSTGYTFTSLNGSKLFDVNWNYGQQSYQVKTKPNLIKIDDFFTNYYETIEYPNTDDVVKNTMLLVLQSDDSATFEFNGSLNNLEKMVKKILSYCNVLNTGTKPLKNNPTDVFNEDDVDIEKFFDFDNNEGIDLDDEDARYRRVLKFKDCDNFEIPVNSMHIEDFVYLNKFNDDDIINALKKSSNDVSNNSDNNMFYLSLFNSFITKLPVALISLILSPKILFPVIISYKVIQNITTVDVVNTINVLMKKLKTMFYNIIRKIFKVFILHFWNLIKRDLLKFITKVAAVILTNKLKRYKNIVSGLIALLTKLLTIEVNNCVDLFNLVNIAIDGAFSVPAKIPLPGVLLGFADALPGYSSDRAFMNIMEKLENSGIPTGPLYGESNDLPNIIKSVLDGQIEEQDANAYVQVSNKEVNIPTPIGPIIIPPGIINCAGKSF